MKQLLFIAFLSINLNLFAQKTCEYSTDVKDSLGTYKSTKDYLVHERNFGSSSNYIYFSLVNTDGTPTLNVQFIDKSDGFTKAKCVDKNSKIYFQLSNGKIITLVAMDNDDCGTLIIDEKKKNNRFLSSFFMFLKGTLDDLKSAPISLMRIKFTTENEDYVFTKSLHSELDNLYYEPENYFINYLKCVE
jgi:hypothetical protein